MLFCCCCFGCFQLKVLFALYFAFENSLQEQFCGWTSEQTFCFLQYTFWVAQHWKPFSMLMFFFRHSRSQEAPSFGYPGDSAGSRAIIFGQQMADANKGTCKKSCNLWIASTQRCHLPSGIWGLEFSWNYSWSSRLPDQFPLKKWWVQRHCTNSSVLPTASWEILGDLEAAPGESSEEARDLSRDRMPEAQPFKSALSSRGKWFWYSGDQQCSGTLLEVGLPNTLMKKNTALQKSSVHDCTLLIGEGMCSFAESLSKLRTMLWTTFGGEIHLSWSCVYVAVSGFTKAHDVNRTLWLPFLSFFFFLAVFLWCDKATSSSNFRIKLRNAFSLSGIEELNVPWGEIKEKNRGNPVIYAALH